MQAESARPSIGETCFRWFDRPLHPELFSPMTAGHLKTTCYTASIGICSGGHFLQLTCRGNSIAEVTAPDSQVLSTFGLQRTCFFPQREELLIESGGPIGYHFAGQVDPVEFSVFSRVQLELEQQARRAFLSYQFPARHRLLPGPLSLVMVEGSSRMLNISTFHTFPEDLVILRTQSLFELN